MPYQVFLYPPWDIKTSFSNILKAWQYTPPIFLALRNLMQGNLQTQKHIWIWSHLATTVTQYYYYYFGFVSWFCFFFFKDTLKRNISTLKASSSNSSSITSALPPKFLSLRLRSHFILWSTFPVPLLDTLSESFLHHSNTYCSWSTLRKRKEVKAPVHTKNCNTLLYSPRMTNPQAEGSTGN